MLHKVTDTPVLNAYTLDYYSFIVRCINRVHLYDLCVFIFSLVKHKQSNVGLLDLTPT